MPPLSPATVVQRFQRRIADVLRDFDELFLAVHQKQRQASLETMVAEQSALLIAVLWETFVNDLLVAYIVQDPQSCLENFESRFRQSITEKFAGASRWVSLEFPSVLSQTQAERIVDPKGWNLAAASAQGLSELANRHLNAVNGRKFSLEADDRDLIDYLVALRNYLSHRSAGSRLKFIDALRALKAGGSNDRLIGSAQNVGMHLKQRIAAGGTRLNVIGHRTVDISGKLL
jgi:hypothetical protein